jgi:hypothetical protein
MRPSDRVQPWRLAGALLLALAGCATPPPPPPPPRAALPVPAVVAPAPAPTPAPVATPFPVAPGGAAAAAPPAAAPASAAGPYSAAVAARFPDPPVRYNTPAFEAGRTSFTSNAELAAALRALQRDGRGGGTTVRLLPLGSSQAGVPIEALLFTRNADASTAAVVQAGRPTVLLVGQQHGDEPAGAEALLVVAQELAQGRLAPLLDKINVVVLPRANPDGAERGTRVTASGIDANRDHLLLRTPEVQAQAQLVREFRPVVVVDAHEHTVIGRYLEKFGAVQRFDALLQYAMTANLPAFVTRAADEWFHRPLLAALKREGLTSEWYYTTSFDLADRRVSMGGVQPDNARNVNGLKNTVSLLVETRGVGLGRLHFARRVHTHVVAAQSVLASAAARADELLRVRQFVEQDVAALACKGDVVVEAGPTPTEKSLLMLDPVTGADKPVLVAWDSALELRPRKVRPRPCGYWLAADQADAVMRLRALGVTVQQFTHKAAVRGETYRELAREEGVRADVRGVVADAATVLRVQVETVPTLVDATAGSYFVPLTQPLANLVVAALEPDTQNSYLSSRIVAGVDRLARLLDLPDGRLTPLP